MYYVLTAVKNGFIYLFNVLTWVLSEILFLPQIVCEYIERLYFEPINLSKNIAKTLDSILENVVKNGLKSHRKSSQTVFDILGICYQQTALKSTVAA